MTEVVLRYKDQSVLPIIADVRPDGSVVPNLADADWSIDTGTDPVDARAEIARLTLEAQAKAAENPPAPHFAAVEAAPVGDPVEIAQTKPAPAPVAVKPSEQGEDVSLDLTKE